MVLLHAVPDHRRSPLAGCVSKLIDFGFARELGVSAHGASKRVSRRSSPSRRGPEGGRADSRDSSVHGHETWAALDMDGSLDFDGRTHAASWQNTTYLPSSPVRQRDWALQSASVAEERTIAVTPVGTRHWCPPRPRPRPPPRPFFPFPRAGSAVSIY